MNSERPIAHVTKNADGSWAEPQGLEEHLLGTARLAEGFAAAFDSGPWGYAEGIGHDTGKSTEIWQRYLCTKSGYDEDAHLETKAGKQEHSAPGAKLIEEALGRGIGRILSYCIAGHHAGLADWLGSQSALAFRLQNTSSEGIPDEYREQWLCIAPPSRRGSSTQRDSICRSGSGCSSPVSWMRISWIPKHI